MSEKVSKWLTFALRHGAAKLDIYVHPDGWVAIDDLLEQSQVQTSYAEIEEIVRTDPKQRFEMQDWDGKSWIRACKGHSMTKVSNKPDAQNAKKKNTASLNKTSGVKKLADKRWQS